MMARVYVNLIIIEYHYIGAILLTRGILVLNLWPVNIVVCQQGFNHLFQSFPILAFMV